MKNNNKTRDELMDALNYIDEQAENGDPTLKEQEERLKCYEKVADFIYETLDL